ncbi:phospho-sugar mutase [Ructibacterium gallinarum]|uniref:phosphoglucomutase (alpha-D-glucose-1,6-bisphosphate-dependent) n=1 Tax=Ructibacterium gallinarum TaxID=2779355 RepID=A0A9D5R8I6_9FIRM|nr:phospho-sugar mutase [Ructibacterium gallinarum]MBE5040002.1 phospho-sugar mutase [Ructibacterium gallinarum]
MDALKTYEKWIACADEKTAAELSALTDQNEIKDRFYRELEFGTGGLRGVMAAGTNRMNSYVIGKATQGLAEYIKEQGIDARRRGVVIAHDSRNHSREFAEHTAAVLQANSITVYLFDSLRPTPMLSFAVRYLHAFAGIVITASHNPAEYNGYKVYFEDGGQLPPSVSDRIIHYIDRIDPFTVSVEPPETPEEGIKFQLIGKEVDDAYIAEVKKQAVHPELSKTGYRLIYTPLHGSGNIPVRRILKETGFDQVLLVQEQVEPDGNFPTVKSPNPENKECFTRAIALAKENSCDLIIGTDPDSDRVGIVVRDQSGDYITMTGNQVGALLTNYMLSQKQAMGTLPPNGAVVSTIVTTGMLKSICQKYGVTFFQTLTGFKFIGEKIHEFEQENSYTFLLGLEESYGYLAGTYARDKDAVVASMLIAEMAVYYHQQGKTLYDVMQDLYQEYGYYLEETVSITLKGMDGAEKIQALMSQFRNAPFNSLGDYEICGHNDYLTGKGIQNGTSYSLSLPQSNVLEFLFANGSTFVIRPSGTEPKIKLYYMIRDKDANAAQAMLHAVQAEMQSILGQA